MPRIELLGGVTVTGPDASVPADVFAGRRGRVALAVLAMERGRTVEEDELAEALWPRALPPTWRPALRSALSRVRDVLGAAGIEPAIVTRGGCVTLHLPLDVLIDVDAARLEVQLAVDALASGDHHRAATAASRATATLANPLLPRETSEWVERRRTRLRLLRERALALQGTALLGCGDHDHAIEAAEELIRAEPFDEVGHRLLMRALAGGGRRAAALRAYDRCRHDLAEELGVAPEAATAALHLELLGSEPARPAPEARPPGAFWPARDQRQLEEWWHAAADGGPPVLALSGDSGSGKHDLINALARSEGAVGTAIVRLRAGAEPTLDELATAVLAIRSPRVLVVVGDADGAADLDAVLTLPGLASGRIGLVLEHRTDRPWLGGGALTGVLDAFERRRMLRRLVMSPLDQDDATRLLEAMTGHPADDTAHDLAADLVAECGGNQGLIRLRVLGLMASGALRPHGAGWRLRRPLGAEPIPGALIDAVAHWASTAPGDLVETLRRIAARSVRPQALDVADGESPATDQLHLAAACGILAERGGAWRFVHPVIGRCWAEGRLNELNDAAGAAGADGADGADTMSPVPAAAGETRRSHEIRNLRGRC